MVLRGQINNISQPHVHAGSDITTGEIDEDRVPRIDELREPYSMISPNPSTDLDVSDEYHGLCPLLVPPLVGGKPKYLKAGSTNASWDELGSIGDHSDLMIVAPEPYNGRLLAYNYSQSKWYPQEWVSAITRQAVINGNFDVWQRGTSFTSTTTPANSDDTYLPDRWILLSDGKDIVDVSRESTVIPEGSAYSLKCEVETANKKFGWLQIIESADALKFAGKNVSLSFQARTTASYVIENIRAAVISWDGTADTVTSDVVSAWNAEGSNPTLAANWTYENTPSNLELSTSFQTFEIEAIAVDTSGMKNLAVFIWVDDTDAAVNDLLYISQVQLCAGDIALPFEPKSCLEEYTACLRFYYEMYQADYRRFANGLVHNSTDAYVYISLISPMRAEPSLSTSATSTFTLFAGGAAFNTVTVTLSTGDCAGFVELKVVKSGFTAGDAAMLAAHSTDDAYLRLSAEL